MVTMVILLATTHKTQTLGKAAKLAGLVVVQAPISLKQTPPLPTGQRLEVYGIKKAP